jgi:hypothetical protein
VDTEKIRGEIQKFLESDKNENIPYEKFCDTAKAVLTGKFIAMSVYKKTKQNKKNLIGTSTK